GCSVPGQAPPSGRTPLAAAAMMLGAALWRKRWHARPMALRSRRTLRVLGATLAITMGFGSVTSCSCSDDSTDAARGTCNPPACKGLEPGLIGAYTSAAVGSDGTIWVAGYLEGNYNDPSYNYGDLVLGKWDDAGDRVAWTIVDGVPSEPLVDPSKFDL